jgi:hypothetical protein
LRPDRIGSGKLSNPTINQWFDLSAFAPPASVIVNGTAHYTFGDSGRNILLGPRQVDTDLSLGKNFKLTERLGLEFRADSYNVFNHPQFNNPSSSITFSGGVPVAGSAGQITSANCFGPGRIIQLGGRVSF